MLRRNWLQALVAAVAVTVGTGCGDECVDAFDCRNDNGQPAEGQQWVCTNDGTCEQQPIPQPPPEGTECTSTAGCELTQVCNTETGFCEDTTVANPADTSAQIQAFLEVDAPNANTPVDPALPITGAFVTFIKPSVEGQSATEPTGFFLQAQADGPAMFVSDAEALGQVAVGDRVSLSVTQKTVTSGVDIASDVTDLTIVSREHPVQNLNTATPAGLKVDRTEASDLETTDAYASELITLSGTIAGASSGAGTAFLGFPITTTGESEVANTLRLRVPSALASELGVEEGCQFTMVTGPVWRFNATTQPSVFSADQLTLSNCPAPKVTSVSAPSATQVTVNFSRPLDPASVQASDFAIPNLQVDSVAVEGSTVTLTTAEQTSGQAYELTVTEVTDRLGTAIDTAANTGNFSGFTPPPASAPLVINEVEYDMAEGAESREFVEIYNRSSETVSLSNIFLVFINGSGNASYQKLDLSGVTDGSLAPGEYLVVGPATVVGPLAGRAGVKTLQQGTTNFIQNGAPDGVAIYDGNADRLIDSLSYEGNITQASITGTTTLFDIREGTGDTANVEDSTSVEGSLCRSPDSADSNSNADDFRFTTTITPGAANVITAP